MDFARSEEEMLLAEMAEGLVRDHPEESLAGAEMMERLAGLGLFQLCLPADAGGADDGSGNLAALLVALMQGLGPAPQVAALVPLLAGSPTLLDADPGATVVVLADAEGNFAGEVPEKTRIETVDGGMVLVGGKDCVAGGSVAGAFLVTARHGEDTVLVRLAANTPGLRCLPYTLLDGSPAADLRFEAISLAPEAVLPVQAGRLSLARDRVRLAAAAAVLGAARAALALTSEHLKTRSQFGGPLARFQALKHQMADAFVLTEELQSILYHGIAGFGRPEDRPKAMAAVANLAARVGRQVGETCVQLHGAMGLTLESPVAALFKSMFVLSGCYGPESVELARYQRLGPSRDALDLMTPTR